MKGLFKSSLVKDVVISYVCMIVFPVMIILGMVFLAAGRYIYRAATDSVTVTQHAILELYQEEMRSSALALSRVVNMNNGTTINDAASRDPERQVLAMKELDTMYQMLAAPEYKILDIHIYRKDGSSVIPKGEMRYRVEELRLRDWYQAALMQPGQVHTALEDEDYFYRLRSDREILEIAAYVPRDSQDAECIVLYRISKIPDSIKNYNKTGRTGALCLIDSHGNVVADPSPAVRIPDTVTEAVMGSEHAEQQISYHGIRYMVMPIPESGYYLISVVNETSLFGQFTLFSFISMAVILCMVLMFIIYFKWYMNRLLLPLGHLTKGMREIEHHNLDTQVPVCRQKDMAQIISTFNNMVEQIKRLIEDKERMEKEKYQEELHTLQSQMNPHFLMNTLNTLKFMAISAHYTGMQDMVVALENILDAVLNRDGGFYTVKEELSVLQSYIYIMQFRYIDSFEVDMDMSPDVLTCKIPKLILQPIVENCITHGFEHLEDRLGTIAITGSIRNERLIFQILDNGKGMDPAVIEEIFKHTENKQRRTIGVSNTDRRLKLNFGPQYGVSIDSEPGAYTRVTLTLPVIMDKAEDDSHVHCTDS